MEKLNMIKNTGLMTSISKLEDDNKDERNLFLGRYII